MAEESITISVSPEVGSLRRNSVGIPSSPFRSSVGGNPRRYSTGKPSSRNTEEIIPNYLRASTGSCHDLCKFGHAHGFKARTPIPKRTVKSVSNEEKGIKTIIVEAERKKTTMAKLKPSPDPKIHAPEPPEIIKREIVLPSKKVEISSTQNSSTNRKITENEPKILAKYSPSLKPKPKPVRVVNPSSFSDVSVGLNGRRNSENKIGKQMGIPKAAVKKEVLPTPTASSSPSLTRVAVKKVLQTPTASTSTKPSVSRVISLKARKYKNLKLVSPLKDQNRMPKTELKKKQPDGNKVKEKTLHVIEPETENQVLESVPTGDIMIIQSPASPPVVSPESSACKSLQSSFPDKDESEYTDSDGDDYVSENDEIVNTDGLEASRKGRVICSEDKDDAAVKLKFRRGKIVDLQSENNAPRRLRFRRGRVLGDNEDGLSGGARKRSFKKKVIEDSEAKDSALGSESVILKHQDVQGKKDGQGLLNNVIEETASKLVESRKSKVKALVGAFETVISLHDSKPSTQTVT